MFRRDNQICACMHACVWAGKRGMDGGKIKRTQERGRTHTVIGSAGMTGKSSGEGKCVRPKVCHSTTSSLSRFAEGFAAIQAGSPWEGSPEVCGTWRPAGCSWVSSSVFGRKERGLVFWVELGLVWARYWRRRKRTYTSSRARRGGRIRLVSTPGCLLWGGEVGLRG